MSFDLTNKNISDTFQNLLQKTGSGNQLYDLKGNQITDLTIAGALHAQSYIVSQSVTVATSGSTIFGDSSDDTHTFEGSITASGNISASGATHTFGGSVQAGFIQGNSSLKGNKIVNLTQDEPYIEVGNNFDVTIGDPQGAANSTILFVDDTNNRISGEAGSFVFADGFVDITVNTDATDDSGDTGALRVEGGGSIAKKLYVGGNFHNDARAYIGVLQVQGDITASGDISASGNLYSSVLYGSPTEILASHKPGGLNLQIYGASEIPNQYNGNTHTFTGNITASGNISASGTIVGSKWGDDLTVVGDITQTGDGVEPFLSSSKGNVVLSGSGVAQLLVNTEDSSGKTLTVRGDISSSGDLFFNDKVSINQSVDVTGNVTASADIVAGNDLKALGSITSSGGINTSGPSIFDGDLRFQAGQTLKFNDAPSTQFIEWDSSAENFEVGNVLTKTVILGGTSVSDRAAIHISGSYVGIGITSAESRPHNHLQVRGNISASTSIFAESTIQAGGNITADNGQAFLGAPFSNNNAALILTDASNNYSASLIQGNINTSLKLSQHVNQNFSIDTKNTDNNFYIEGAGGNVGIKKIPSSQDVDFTVAGDISASGFIKTDSHITASGNISSSGDLNIKSIYLDDDNSIYNKSETARLRFKTDELKVVSGRFNVATNITASGNISSSGTIIAEQLTTSDDLSVGDNLQFTSVGASIRDNSDNERIDFNSGDTHFNAGQQNLDFKVETEGGTTFHIDGEADGVVIGGTTVPSGMEFTVNGDISASGLIYASASVKEGLTNVITYDVDTDQFHYTSSAAYIGGGGGSGDMSDVVDDTTPQLGGDLDLNSQNITGTGDINITGDITSSKITTTHITASGGITASLNQDSTHFFGKAVVGHPRVLGDSYANDVAFGHIDWFDDSGGGNGYAVKQDELSNVRINSRQGKVQLCANNLVAMNITHSGSPKVGLNTNPGPTSQLLSINGDMTVGQIKQFSTGLSPGINLGILSSSYKGGNGELTVSGDISGSGDIFTGDTAGAYFSSSLGNMELSGSGKGQIEVDYRLFDTGSLNPGIGSAQGDIVKFGGTATTAGQVYYLTAAGGWASTDADAGGTTSGSIAVALGTNASNDGMILKGIVTLDHDPGGSLGAPVYLSTTAGRTSTDAPGSGDFARIIGYKISGSFGIYFNPDNTTIEVA